MHALTKKPCNSPALNTQEQRTERGYSVGDAVIFDLRRTRRQRLSVIVRAVVAT